MLVCRYQGFKKGQWTQFPLQDQSFCSLCDHSAIAIIVILVVCIVIIRNIKEYNEITIVI